MAHENLTDMQLIETTVAAMAPYRCVAELRDYKAKFGFAVYYGEDDYERQVFEFPRRDVRRAADLIAALNDARHRMSGIGINFAVWNNEIRG
jgi:hypothetical protein